MNSPNRDASGELPPRPNLGSLRKRAKRLLKAWRRHEPEALARLTAACGSRRPPRTPKLHHAQFVIAREHGFASWPRLVHDVRARSAREAIAAVVVDAALLPGSVHEVRVGSALAQRLIAEGEVEVFVVAKGNAAAPADRKHRVARACRSAGR